MGWGLMKKILLFLLMAVAMAGLVMASGLTVDSARVSDKVYKNGEIRVHTQVTENTGYTFNSFKTKVMVPQLGLYRVSDGVLKSNGDLSTNMNVKVPQNAQKRCYLVRIVSSGDSNGHQVKSVKHRMACVR